MPLVMIQHSGAVDIADIFFWYSFWILIPLYGSGFFSGSRDHDTNPIFTEQGVLILEDEPMGKFSISCIQLKRSVNKYRY